MYSTRLISTVALFFVAITCASASNDTSTFAHCSGYARYNITFLNLMTPRRFGSLIPSTGLVYSPLTVVSHSNRISILTVRGYASKDVQAIAETGDNAPLLKSVGMLRMKKEGVKGYKAASGGTMPGKSVSVAVNVDCMHPFITGLSMIAPSPDWIVQINNMNMYSRRFRKFRYRRFGFLIAYDAGTDDGREFTPPSDLSLDKPTVPQQNIAPLVEDETDRLRGRVVGRYMIKKIKPENILKNM